MATGPLQRLVRPRLTLCRFGHILPSMVKPVVWMHGQVKTPPFSPAARLDAGILLRRLQLGEKLGMPHSRPLPAIGTACHELRLVDGTVAWRIVYGLAPDAVVVLAVFSKKTRTTPVSIMTTCRRRWNEYLAISAEVQR